MQLKKDEDDVSAVNSGGSGNVNGNMYGAPVNNNTYGAPTNNGYGNPMNNYVQPQGLNVGYDSPSKSSGGYLMLFKIFLLIVIAGIAIYAAVKKFGNTEYTPGTTSGQVYRNEYFGFKMTAGSGFMVVPNAYDAEGEKKALKNNQIVIEYEAVNMSNSNEILAFIIQKAPYYITKSNTNLADELDKNQDKFRSEAETSGFTIISMERDSITVDGEVYEGFKMTATADNVTNVGYVQYYIAKGNYLGALTAFGNTDSQAKQLLLDNLSKLEN